MRIKCQVCGDLGYLQRLGHYCRVRHYRGINKDTNKSEFFYHQQSKDYVERILRDIKPDEKSGTDTKEECSSVQCKSENNIDLKLGISSQNCIMEPRAGFEPATYSLQGCRSGQLSYRGTYLLHHRGRK